MRCTVLAATAFILLGGAGVAQEDYPSRPIAMIVPFAAGGPTDTVARLVAESMSGTLGQQVLVENVAGAGGTLGARRVAQADPDGYTLLLHHIGQSTAPALYKNLPFDPAADFTAIGLVTDVPMTVIGRKDLEPGSVGELLDWIRENKDAVTVAHAGVGSASQLCAMLLQDALDVQVTTVPYKGTGPAMTDLLGGQVDLLCDQTTNTTGPITSGDVKAYAVTTPERLASFPDLPTLQESGLEGFQVAVWHGLYAPKDTPQPVVDELESALQAALQDPKVVERFGDLGTEPAAQERATSEALQQHLQDEIARWQPIIESAGVYAE